MENRLEELIEGLTKDVQNVEISKCSIREKKFEIRDLEEERDRTAKNMVMKLVELDWLDCFTVIISKVNQKLDESTELVTKVKRGEY